MAQVFLEGVEGNRLDHFTMGRPILITRDSTYAFQKKRYEHLHEKRSAFGLRMQRQSQPLLLDCDSEEDCGALTKVVVEMNILPPKWCDFNDDAREGLEDIRRKLAQLARAHQKRFLKVFDDGMAEHAVQELTQEITSLIRHCEEQIREVGITPSGTAGGWMETQTQENLLQRNAQRNLAMQLQQLSKQFRQAQQQYLDRVQCQPGSTWIPDDCSTNTGGSNPEANHVQSQAQVALELEAMEIVALQRNKEICDIVSSINDMQTMFKQLAVMVIDQGTVLDRIDYNVELVLQQTTKTNNELEKSVKTRKTKNNCANRIIFFLVTLNALLMLILFAKIYFRPEERSPGDTSLSG